GEGHHGPVERVDVLERIPGLDEDHVAGVGGGLPGARVEERGGRRQRVVRLPAAEPLLVRVGLVAEPHPVGPLGDCVGSTGESGGAAGRVARPGAGGTRRGIADGLGGAARAEPRRRPRSLQDGAGFCSPGTIMNQPPGGYGPPPGGGYGPPSGGGGYGPPSGGGPPPGGFGGGPPPGGYGPPSGGYGGPPMGDYPPGGYGPPPGMAPMPQPPPQKGMSGAMIALLVIVGLLVLGGGCSIVVCVGIVHRA